jgi:glycosyltransferase involved in cell wall biosynthesis
MADATPVVFSEAQAFGCPSITYDVGGTSSMVLDRQTGIVMPLGATAEDFVDRIQELVRAPQRYEVMSRECLRRYKELANWEVWARTILRLANTDGRSSIGQSSSGMAEIDSTSVRPRAPSLSLPEKGQ